MGRCALLFAMAACLASFLHSKEGKQQPIVDAVTPQDRPELFVMECPLIVVAKQVGSIDRNRVQDKIFGEIELIDSDFVVQKIIKGRIVGRRIRVHAGLFDRCTEMPEENSNALLFLAPDSIQPGFELRGFVPAKDEEELKKFEEQFCRVITKLETLRAEALAELEAYAPKALQRAKELLPAILTAEAALASRRKENDDKFEQEPWVGLQREDVLVIRALGILKCPDTQSDLFERTISNRRSQLTDDDKKTILGWFQYHYRKLESPEALSAFAAPNTRLVSRLCLDFPPTIQDEYGNGSRMLFVRGRRLMVLRHDEEDRHKPDLETFNALYFLMCAEDSTLHTFWNNSKQSWIKQGFKEAPRKPGARHFDPMKLALVSGLLREWLKADADPRLRTVALQVMSEQPPEWTRGALEEARKAPDFNPVEWAGVAAGLRDSSLVSSLWEQGIKLNMDEGDFLDRLYDRGYFEAEAAAFALKRWCVLETGKDVSSRIKIVSYRNYLSACRQKLAPKEKVFESVEEAATWLTKAEPKLDLADTLSEAKRLSRRGIYDRENLRDEAEAGNPVAQFVMGSQFFVKKDYANAVLWTRLSAESGFRPAQKAMSLACLNGLGVPRDQNAAMKWMSKAEEPHEETEAEALLAEITKDPRWMKSVVDLFTESANNGDAFSQLWMGLAHLQGIGMEADPIKGKAWLEKAAEQNNVNAQAFLGSCLKSGTHGLERDAKDALKWLRRAAENNDPNATLLLGSWLAMGGDGIEPDLPEAAKWMKLSADKHNDPIGQWCMGILYEDEKAGLGKDMKMACAYYRRAAEQGRTEPAAALASTLLEGKGVEKDPVEALKWLKKAGDAGDESARYLLADCFVRGIGTPKDLPAARRIYRTILEERPDASPERLRVLPPEEHPTPEDSLVDLKSEAAEASLIIDGVDRSGNPVTGITFTISVSMNSKSSSRGLHLLTKVLVSDDHGQVVIKNIAPGSYSIYLTAYGAKFTNDSKRILPIHPTNDNLDSYGHLECRITKGVNRYLAVLDRGGSVKVRVITQDGKPAADIALYQAPHSAKDDISSMGDRELRGQFFYFGKTDEAGELTASCLETGAFKLVARQSDNAQVISNRVSIEEGELTEIKEDLRLSPFTRVESKKTSPATHRHITREEMEKEKGTFRLPSSNYTDCIFTPEGVFPSKCYVVMQFEHHEMPLYDSREGRGTGIMYTSELPAEWGKPKRIVVNSPGFKEAVVDSPANLENIKIPLERMPYGQVLVKVVSEDGGALKGATVWPVPPKQPNKHWSTFLTTIDDEPENETDASGLVSLILPQGKQRLAAKMDGYLCESPIEVEVFSDKTQNAIIKLHILKEAIRLKGRVKVPAGNSVDKTLVFVRDSFGVHRSASVDMNGEYEFRNLRIGELEVWALRPPLAGEVRKVALFSQEEFCDLSMFLPGSLDLRFGKGSSNLRVEIFESRHDRDVTAEDSEKASGWTDEEGQVKIKGLKPGKYDVVANRYNDDDLTLGQNMHFKKELTVLLGVDHHPRDEKNAVDLTTVELNTNRSASLNGRLVLARFGPGNGLDDAGAEELYKYLMVSDHAPKLCIVGESGTVKTELGFASATDAKDEIGAFSCRGLPAGKYKLYLEFKSYSIGTEKLNCRDILSEVQLVDGEVKEIPNLQYSPSKKAIEAIREYRKAVLGGR